MDNIHITEMPDLRSPTLLLAFSGWNDASNAATTAASFIREELDGSEFASIDSDIFYNFQDTRPLVSLDEEGQRQIAWPCNTFYACRTPHIDHDLILFVGVEPHLQWKQFTQIIYSLAEKCGVRMAVTLGALLADVYHRSAVRITGSSTNLELAERLGLKRSGYEGPTGIVGILNNLFKDQSLPAVSIWANVPHYVNVTPNPKAALALVRRLSEFLMIDVNVSELESGSLDFDDKVDQALESNKAVKEYVEELKHRSETEEEEESGGLPPGEDVAREVERFLRERERGKNGDADS
jgi:proteasome assembly chaperone (PAC2) family protein